MQAEVRWLMEYFNHNPFIQDLQDTVDTLIDWAYMSHGYASKNQRLAEWAPEDEVMYDVAYHIFAMALLHPSGITYQAMIGAIANHVQCNDSLDRAKTAAEMIAIAYQCELIVITKVTDKTFMITTNHELLIPIPKFVQHLPLFNKPEPVNSKILGSRFKQHDGDVCDDHINRMNAISLTLETRIIDSMPETTTNIHETAEQEQAWNVFVDNSSQIYDLIREQGNIFYLSHSNDTRGRCYASGYCVGYQGSSYKKSIVQLADKEVVKL